MKIVMDEKQKHRLVGLAVVVSIGIIFVPAMIKKSSQKLEDNFSVSIEMPKKPKAPDVAVKDEEALFKTIKVARVKLPDVPAEKQLPQLVQAEPIKIEDEVTRAALQQAKNQVTREAPVLAVAEVKKPVVVAATKPAPVKIKPVPKVAAKPVARPKQITPKVAVKKPLAPVVRKQPQPRQPMYAVQLASFSNLSNAQALVSRLNARGYKASYIRLATSQGPVYKVYAGHSPRKNDVVQLKVQLASSMQLYGFVVNTGVS